MALLLSGCTSMASSYKGFIEGLNARELKSCIYFTGTLSGNYGVGGSVLLRGVTVTGGAEMPDCIAAQEVLR